MERRVWLPDRASIFAAIWPAQQDIAGYGCRQNLTSQRQLEDLPPGCQQCNKTMCSDAAQCLHKVLCTSAEAGCTMLELALLAKQCQCTVPNALDNSIDPVATSPLKCSMILFLRCSHVHNYKSFEKEACSLST